MKNIKTIKYNPNNLKGYPLNILTIFRFEGCHIEANISGRVIIAKVIELDGSLLSCEVEWDANILNAEGTLISVCSDELRRNLGMVDDFEQEYPEYFV